MERRLTRREVHGNNGNKIMKKVNKSWVAVACSLIVAGGTVAPIAQNVLAAPAVESNEKEDFKSSFEGKENLLKQDLVKAEIQKANDKKVEDKKVNSAEEIKAEMKRQAESGLTVYVIQKGDELDTIAKAANTSVKTLIEGTTYPNTDITVMNAGGFGTSTSVVGKSDSDGYFRIEGPTFNSEENHHQIKIMVTDPDSGEMISVVPYVWTQEELDRVKW